MRALLPHGRCHATNRKGTQCGYPAIPGGTVCRFHGGAAPQVRAAAERRLAQLVIPAIGRLEKLMRQGKHLPTSLGAVKDILDRAGLKQQEQAGGSGGSPIQIAVVFVDANANNGSQKGNGRVSREIAAPL